MSIKKIYLLIVESDLSFSIDSEILLEKLGYHTIGRAAFDPYPKVMDEDSNPSCFFITLSRSVKWCKFLALAFIFLSSFSILKSQTDSIDLIRNQYYSEVKKKDLNAATSSAFLLTKNFSNIKVDSSLFWVKKALKHAEATKDSKMVIEGLLTHSKLSFAAQQHKYSLRLAEQADSLLTHFPDSTQQMICLFRRAEGHEFTDNQKLAMELYLDCFNMAEKLNHVDMLVRFSLKLSNISYINKDYRGSVEHLEKGLKYVESDDKHELSKWMLQIRICNKTIIHPKIFSEQAAIHACEVVNSFFEPSNAFLNHSISAYFKTVKTDCTIRFGTQEIIDKLPLTSIETIKSKSQDKENLLFYLGKNFQIALKQGKLLESTQYINELKSHHHEDNTEGIEKLILIHEADYFKFTEDYKNLVKVNERLHQLQLKFDSDERMSRYTNLEGKLEAKEKAYEIELLATQSKQSRIIALGVSLLALLAFILFRNARRINRKIATQNAEISEKNNQLESLNYTKDRIFAIIGHDLRKPAIAFRGIAKKVSYLIQKKDFETLQEFGEQIEQNALSLSKLTDNLLNWALVQRNVMPYNPEEVNVTNIANDITFIFKGAAENKQLEIINKIPENLIAFADFNALHTILTNLVDNAIKYTPSNGEVRLEAYLKEKQVRIRVTDTGIGMNQDKINDIFLLKSGKSKAGTKGEKGTGLGLHLVKELVDLNKGLIQVVSKIGEGTSFELILPGMV